MADGTYQPKIYKDQGGDRMVVKSGGQILFEGTNSAKGYVVFDLKTARLVASNDVPNTAATPSGGILTSNTAPALIRVSTNTDKALRVLWAASSVVELILGSFMYPADLDPTADVVVKILAAMGGSSDTPTMGISYFEGVGDGNAGGSTAAITGTTPAVYSVTVATADVAGEYPTGFATIGLTPAAHGTDALALYGAWVEYTKKTTYS